MWSTSVASFPQYVQRLLSRLSMNALVRVQPGGFCLFRVDVFQPLSLCVGQYVSPITISGHPCLLQMRAGFGIG